MFFSPTIDELPRGFALVMWLRTPHLRLMLAVTLLLLMAALRLHDLTLQEPFIDEGAHVQRARMVWSFEENPGRFSNGKLLLYYWLGVFELPPIDALWIARAAVALVSLITGAAVFALGRTISGPAALVALGLYALLPLAFFFERMALADPFAAMFLTLAAWRSIRFARQPSLREALVVGLLSAAATLAKMTVGLAPLVPFAATLLWTGASDRAANGRARLRIWRRRYGRGLAVIAATVVVCWLPLLIPAGVATLQGDPFTLVNGANMAARSDHAPLAEARAVAPDLVRYTSLPLMLAALLTLGGLLWRTRHDPARRAYALFVLAWAFLIAVLPLLAARDVRTRYFMPLAAPLSVLIGWAIAALWRTRQRVVQLALALGAAAWLGGFAIPFAWTTVTAPDDLPLPRRDAAVFLGGNFAGDAMREAAALLERVAPSDAIATPIVADRATCDMLYFFTTRPITCAASIKQPVELLSAAESYVILNGHEPQPDRLRLAWELIAEYERPALRARASVTRTVQVWRVRAP